MGTNNSSSEAFIKSLDRSMRKKRVILFTLLAVLVVIIILVVSVSVGINRKNKIDKAKSVISQIDIKSTFKKPEFHDLDDWDNDGIKNKEESVFGTGIQSEDTDGDGLSDGDEKLLGTDPTKYDTDGDMMLDGYEIIAGTDPTTRRSDGETEDAQRVLEIVKTDGDCTITLTGNPNVAGSSVEKLDLFGITSNSSVVSDAYDFYTEYSFQSAEISIKVNDSKMKKFDFSFDDLSVLKFDAKTLQYTKLDSSSDKSKGTVTAKITESGTYVVGAEKTVNDPAVTRVCFLIDNSGSMYPVELCPTSSENDVEFKRLDFAQSLINKFDADYQIAICKFTGTYTKMTDFTTDRIMLSETLRAIRNNDEIFDGTHNQTALKNCINEFKEDKPGKYRNIIVMLSDGESDEVDAATVEELTALANDKNVIVLTVGLGRDIDREWLRTVAESTVGKYYAASDANALDDVYKQIEATFNYDIVEYSDAKDKISGYMLYNTGFDPARNGFSFKNFRTTTTSSVDFGIAVMARDWYMGTLPLSLGDIEPADDSEQKVNAPGYDLTNVKPGQAYAARKVMSIVAPQIFFHRYSKVKEYIDYTSSGNVLKVKKDYRYDAKSKGWEIYKTRIDGGNLSWEYVELLNLDIANGLKKIENTYSTDDSQLVAALYRLNALQWDDSEYEFTLTGGDDGFDYLCELLADGVPVVTTIDDTHTVNTIGLIRDSSCHRKYILRIYDNNYPMTTKELYLEKKPVVQLDMSSGEPKVIGEGFAYEATYEGKQVGISFSNVPTH